LTTQGLQSGQFGLGMAKKTAHMELILCVSNKHSTVLFQWDAAHAMQYRWAVKFGNNRHWTGMVCCRAGCALSADGLSSSQDIIGTLFSTLRHNSGTPTRNRHGFFSAMQPINPACSLWRAVRLIPADTWCCSSSSKPRGAPFLVPAGPRRARRHAVRARSIQPLISD
jgi:hypothetical protein